MRGRSFPGFSLGLLLFGPSFSAQATLIGVLPTISAGTNYQAYNDTVANLAWLADASAHELMTWQDAMNLSADLNINGVTRWTLPTTTQPDSIRSYQSGSISRSYKCVGGTTDNLFHLPNLLFTNSRYLTELPQSTGLL